MKKMTRKQFIDITTSTFDSIRNLTATKGGEYAGKEVDENEHANFDRLAQQLDLSPEKVLWVYLTKHMDSILTWINRSPAEYKPSEPITGRIDDAILYLLLLKGMHERRNPKSKSLGWEIIHPDAMS